jgi:hypothetical protein
MNMITDNEPSEHSERSDTDNDEYIARAEEMDAEYVEAFEELSPTLRETMRKLGVDKPELNDPESKQGSRDVSEWVELQADALSLSEEQDFAYCLSEMFDIPPSTAARLLPWLMKAVEREVARQKSDYLGRVVGLLLREANVKVCVMGLAFAMEFKELERMGLTSMRRAAPRVGCTASYLSQHANKWCDALELPRPKCMKSQEARETYSEERKNNHWRHQTC